LYKQGKHHRANLTSNLSFLLTSINPNIIQATLVSKLSKTYQIPLTHMVISLDVKINSLFLLTKFHLVELGFKSLFRCYHAVWVGHFNTSLPTLLSSFDCLNFKFQAIKVMKDELDEELNTTKQTIIKT